MIYNPYFEKIGINAVVTPMGAKAENCAEVLKALFQLANIRGALATMPHKVASLAFMDEVSTSARIAGARNAILSRPERSLVGDMFDGESLVRGLARKGRPIASVSALVVGSGDAARAAGHGARQLLIDRGPGQVVKSTGASPCRAGQEARRDLGNRCESIIYRSAGASAFACPSARPSSRGTPIHRETCIMAESARQASFRRDRRKRPFNEKNTLAGAPNLGAKVELEVIVDPDAPADLVPDWRDAELVHERLTGE